MTFYTTCHNGMLCIFNATGDITVVIIARSIVSINGDLSGQGAGLLLKSSTVEMQVALAPEVLNGRDVALAPEVLNGRSAGCSCS